MNRAFAMGLFSAVLWLASCSAKDDGPINVSIIGPSTRMPDPVLGQSTAASRLLLGATAQGLVSFDASDQVQPALAERWIVTDDGLSYIFRIREATWSDKQPVTSVDVVNSLKRSLATNSRHPFKGLFTPVTAIIPMTGQVVEIRLKTPEPNFLQLLAQPEMAILRSGGGTGPYAIHSRRDGIIRLRPRPDPEASEAELEKRAGDQNDDVRVRAETATMAIARFLEGDARFVTGGTYADLPLARAADVDAGRFQRDPAYGLFGLAVTASSKTLDSADLRLALTLAIDREALVRSFGVADWPSAISILPAALDSGAAPAALAALQVPIGERRERAKALIPASVRGRTIKVALPSALGGRLLFAHLEADWQRIGIKAVRVMPSQPADLVLIDDVAPVSSAVWYLDRLACRDGLRCNEEAQQLLNEALAELDPAIRKDKIAQADAALVAASDYIPLALPMRWSLVGANLTGWRASAFAVHALDQLRK